MPNPWLSCSKKIWIGSFKWGTKNFCNQEAAKISKVKFEGWEKSCWLGTNRYQRAHTLLNQKTFFDLQIWPLIFLQPFDQNKCLISHLKIQFISVWSQKLEFIHCISLKSTVYFLFLKKIKYFRVVGWHGDYMIGHRLLSW